MFKPIGTTSSAASESSGTLTTRAVTFRGKHLFVNTDCPDGKIQVEVLDESGSPIAPFTEENSIPTSTDKTLVEATWQGAANLSSLANKPVRFRFHLENGRLYSFWVSQDQSGASNGYIAAGGPGFTSGRDVVSNTSRGN